jgi:hypothetical protein
VQRPQALQHELHGNRACHFFAPVGCQLVATGLVDDHDQVISPSRYKLARDGEPINFLLQTFDQMSSAV